MDIPKDAYSQTEIKAEHQLSQDEVKKTQSFIDKLLEERKQIDQATNSEDNPKSDSHYDFNSYTVLLDKASHILDTFGDFKYYLELLDENHGTDYMNLFTRITNWTLRPWIESPDIISNWLFERYHLTNDLKARYYSIPPVVFTDLGKLSSANEHQFYKINVSGDRLNMDAGSCSAVSPADMDDYVDKMIKILKWMIKNCFSFDSKDESHE